MDPLAVKYISWSPYNYALVNPIRFVDPDGRQVIDSYGKAAVSGSYEVYGTLSTSPPHTQQEQNNNEIDTIDKLENEINRIVEEIRPLVGFYASEANYNKNKSLEEKMERGERLTNEEYNFVIEYMQTQNKLSILRYELTKALELYGAYIEDLKKWHRTETRKGLIRTLLFFLPGRDSNPEVDSPDMNKLLWDRILPYNERPTKLPYPLEY